MSKDSAVLEDAPAEELTPDMVSKIKKEDMQQAVFERFRGSKPGSRTEAGKSGKRSPYWQSADDQC